MCLRPETNGDPQIQAQNPNIPHQATCHTPAKMEIHSQIPEGSEGMILPKLMVLYLYSLQGYLILSVLVIAHVEKRDE